MEEVENELAEKLDLDLHLEKDENQKEAEIKERQLSDTREKLDEQLKTNKKTLRGATSERSRGLINNDIN